jgi:hypothetical protein
MLRGKNEEAEEKLDTLEPSGATMVWEDWEKVKR